MPNLLSGIRKKFLFFLFTFALLKVPAQTLIINEVSNGPSGNKEYIELVVVDTTAFYNCGNSIPPCIDIRGWIIDDNSGYHGAGGVAAGANRFSQNALWSCVPLGTIILIYNDADVNADIPAQDLSLSDGNCQIVAPISNTSLFENNSTTPGAVACSYPASGWTPGGLWATTLLANSGDCARIVDLNGCEVFSLCWASCSSNTLIYFSSGNSGTDNVWFFNDGDPGNQNNWSEGCTDPSSCGSNEQTPGLPNNTANQNYIAQFNNNCTPITPINVTANSVDAGCTCDGSASASATGSIPGYSYTWMDQNYSAVIGSGSSITNLCAGTYHVIATSLIGCSDTATIIINSTGSVPVATPSGNSPVCVGDTIFLFAATVNGASYNWTGPNGFSSSSQNPEILNATLSNEGNYTLIVSNGNCSSSPQTIFIDVVALPVISISSNSPLCEGDTLLLSASSPGGNSFLWSGPDNFSSSGNNASVLNVTGTHSGIYTVVVEANGCSNSAQTSVTINSSAAVNIVPVNPVCSNSSAVQLTANVAGGTWSGNGITNSVNGIFSPSVSGSGNHTIIYTTSGSCAGADTIVITVNSLPVADAGTDAFLDCNQTTLNLNGTNSTGNSLAFLWNTTNGNIISGGNSATPLINAPGIYILTLTDTNTCTNYDTVLVQGTPGPTASFSASPMSGTVPLNCTTQNNSSGTITSYEWSTCEGATSNQYEPVFSMDSSGICFIQLIVTDINNCTDTAIVYLNFLNPFSIYIPNVFTPNGDGQNEVFEILTMGIEQLQMQIFNRWGELLYEGNGIHSYWDGTYNSTPVPEGTYYYLINVVLPNQSNENYNGYLTLLRE